jgi:hypothetical protein
MGTASEIFYHKSLRAVVGLLCSWLKAMNGSIAKIKDDFDTLKTVPLVSKFFAISGRR